MTSSHPKAEGAGMVTGFIYYDIILTCVGKDPKGKIRRTCGGYGWRFADADADADAGGKGGGGSGGGGAPSTKDVHKKSAKVPNNRTRTRTGRGSSSTVPAPPALATTASSLSAPEGVPDGIVQLNAALRRVTTKVRSKDAAFRRWFGTPVDDDPADVGDGVGASAKHKGGGGGGKHNGGHPPPSSDYYEIVDTAMALSIILAKCDDSEYLSLAEFIADFRLIARNAYKFYTANDEAGIYNKADKMRNLAIQYVDIQRAELASLDGVLHGAEKEGSEFSLSFDDERKQDEVQCNRELKCAGSSCNDRGSVTGSILACSACSEEYHIECEYLNTGLLNMVEVRANALAHRSTNLNALRGH